MREIESVPALNAKEIAIDTALVAIVSAYNLHAGIGSSYAQRGLATRGAVSASRSYVLHLPGTRLVAVRAGSQCAHRAYIDAHATLFALQMIALIRRNDRTHPAVLHTQ